MCDSLKEEESWRIRTNMEIEKLLKMANVKYINSLTLREYEHTERTNNEIMSKNRDSQNGRNKENRTTTKKMDR
jgi:hypothetical protein